MPSTFYRAFEDQYRGSRALIKARLRIYLPYLVPLAALHPERTVLDLGCGRGEWLELLQDHHIRGEGVDLDDGMLGACLERGFTVQNANALTHLQSLPSQSLLAVTGFHLAEHLPFDTLQQLIAQAQRVLLPDGLLILETPNPENLVVGTANFYLDPTHQRPLPMQLLHFLLTQNGFTRLQHLRLQEDPRLVGNTPVTLFDVLAHASPDYALIAQQTPSAVQPDPLAPAFATEHGLSLHHLANRFDAQTQAQQTAHQTILQAHQAATTQLIERTDQLIQELAALHASASWRLTRPLRWLAQQLRR